MLDTITAHNPDRPLFLVWAAHTVHEPYEVPDADLARFSHIDVEIRQYYAAMVSHLDNLLQPVIDSLKSKGMWNNTLFVATSDNGGPLTRGPSTGLDSGGGSNNYPLRGGKVGVMEGGIRVNGFVSGGFIPPALRGTTYEGWIHLSDWYTTFCALAGVDPYDYRAEAAGLPPVDGLDFSGVLNGTNMTSPRTEIIIGSSDDSDHAGNTIVAGLIDVDGFKLLIEEKISPAFFQGQIYPNDTTTKIEPPLSCGDPDASGKLYGPGCLFNVLDDPSETTDLAKTNPARVKAIRARIANIQKTVYNPDRGSNDREMCLTGWGKWNGYLGPWVP